MTDKTPKVLGILGGLGPMATVYFYEMLTRHTKVSCDQEHIDVIINSRATTPDRTSFILGKSTENPFDIMAKDAERLVTFGADILAIPCNTAHYFYKRLDECVSVPILNMLRETVLAAKESGAEKVGILATSGTILTETYQRECAQQGIAFAVPSSDMQEDIMNIIYNQIKKGERADMQSFNRVADALKKEGCDKIILGCTELSLIKKDEHLDSLYLDSLEVLAKTAILAFGKTPTGFSI
ncbi:MAG: amino acid racemase [Oscillospiraceae bacterium]